MLRCLLVNDTVTTSSLFNNPHFKASIKGCNIIIRQRALVHFPDDVLNTIPLVECLIQKNEQLHTKNIIHSNVVLLETEDFTSLFIKTLPRLYVTSCREDIVTLFSKINIGILECYMDDSHLETFLRKNIWVALPKYHGQPKNLHRLTRLKKERQDQHHA